jgi:hypothetical protein
MVVLAQALNGNTTLRELSVAGNELDADDAKVLAPAIQAMGSLASLNLANNNLARGKSDGYGGYETDMTGVTALADALSEWSVSPADFCPTRHVSYQKSNASGALVSLNLADIAPPPRGLFLAPHNCE